MSKNDINKIQDFLTVQGENKKYQIVNIQLLLRRHTPESVIAFLDQLHREYGQKLKRLIKTDRTSLKLNEIIATKFRIKMAINSIRNYSSEGDRAA